MEMTPFDQVWQTFLDNCKVPETDLPTFDEKIYDAIHNAIMHFNNRLRRNITWNDSTELLSEDLSNDDLLIVAHFLRLIFLTNQKTYFENLFQPFAKDVGMKNFNTQLKSLETSVSEEQRTIDALIRNMQEDYL
jgi:hypothetical protein